MPARTFYKRTKYGSFWSFLDHPPVVCDGMAPCQHEDYLKKVSLASQLFLSFGHFSNFNYPMSVIVLKGSRIECIFNVYLFSEIKILKHLKPKQLVKLQITHKLHRSTDDELNMYTL